jgi:hypothetical protein
MRNNELEVFVKMMGSVTASHEYLCCSYSQLFKMRKGKRSMQSKYAKLITKKYPHLSFEKLFDKEPEPSLTHD